VVETRKLYPDLQLEVFEFTTDKLIEAMARRDIDFGILSPPYKEGSELDAYHLLKDEILLATSAKHLFAKQKSIGLKSLLDQSFVMMTKEHCMSSQAMSFCESMGVTPNVIMRSAQLETTLALVEAGSGITVMPRMAIASHSHRKLNLSSFYPKPLFRDIEIVWRVRNPLNTVQKSFLSMVKELHS
jgi:LysR family hydrogen peroxide-inducible transcriptional activator